MVADDWQTRKLLILALVIFSARFANGHPHPKPDGYQALRTSSTPSRTFAGKGTERRGYLDASTTQLRVAVNRAILAILDAVEDTNNPAVVSQEVREAIQDSPEIQERTRRLLEDIAHLRRLVKKMERDSFHALSFMREILGRDHGGRNDDIILAEIKQTSDNALHAFERGNSNNITEIISNIKNAKEMQHRYQVAEGVSEFLEFVVGDHTGERLLERQETLSVPSTTPVVREELEHWCSGATRKRIYFLNGDAGVGKSCIAYRQCLRLHAEDESLPVLGASFFFEQGRKYFDSPLSLFACLAYQLQPQIRPKTSDNIREILVSAEMQLEKMMLLLRRALRGSASSHTRPRRTALVIDGFNECSDRERIPTSLRYLVALTRDFPWLYLFITSRPHPPIMTVLAHADFRDIVLQRQLELGSGSSAVRSYLEYAIPRIPAYSDFALKYPDALRHLINCAGNRFDVAHLALEYLDSQHNRRPDTELGHLTLRDLSRPSDWDFLYERMFRAERAYLGSRVGILDTIVGFVVYERQELTPRNISIYAYPLISADEIVATVDRLRPILQINTEGKVVFTSSSSRNFLLNDIGGFYGSEPSLTRRLRFSDTPTYSASALLAALLNTTPITNALLTPLPLISVPAAPSTAKHACLALWDRWLPQAKDIWILKDELDAFIPSLPLALYAWVTTLPCMVRAGEAVSHFGSMNVRATRGAEFFKFVAFVQLCRAERLWEDSRHSNDISAADLQEGIALHLRNPENTRIRVVFERNSPLRLYFVKTGDFISVTVDQHDVSRYQAIVQQLFTALDQENRLADDTSLAGIVQGTYRIDDWE